MRAHERIKIHETVEQVGGNRRRGLQLCRLPPRFILQTELQSDQNDHRDHDRTACRTKEQTQHTIERPEYRGLNRATQEHARNRDDCIRRNADRDASHQATHRHAIDARFKPRSNGFTVVRTEIEGRNPSEDAEDFGDETAHHSPDRENQKDREDEVIQRRHAMSLGRRANACMNSTGSGWPQGAETTLPL